MGDDARNAPAPELKSVAGGILDALIDHSM